MVTLNVTPSRGRPRERITFVDDQAAGLGVLNDDRLGIAIGSNDHVGGRLIHHIAGGRLDLRDDVGAGGQIGDMDLTIGIGCKNPVLGQRAVSDDSVQADLAAGRRGEAELRARKRLPTGTVTLLNDQLTLGLVFESEGNRAALLDLEQS